MSRRALLFIAMIHGCGGSTSTRSVSAGRPYGYETDDDPGRHLGQGPNCTPETCKPPQVCVDVTTDTTLDVPEPRSSSVCVSPDSDLCKVDAEACRIKPERAPCSIDDLEATSEGERTLLRNIARECRPIDQCLLECIRSGCADDIGGGCFHACGLRGARPEERDALLLREAAAYRSRTNYFCRRKGQSSLASAWRAYLCAAQRERVPDEER